jgi:hypothetical protein
MTRAPVWTKEIARFATVVLLPSPRLALVTAITFTPSVCPRNWRFVLIVRYASAAGVLGASLETSRTEDFRRHPSTEGTMPSTGALISDSMSCLPTVLSSNRSLTRAPPAPRPSPITSAKMPVRTGCGLEREAGSSAAATRSVAPSYGTGIKASRA